MTIRTTVRTKTRSMRTMRAMRTTMRAGLCLLAGLLTACSDGLLHEAAPPAPGTVSLSAVMLQGGSPEAYAQTNVLRMVFSDTAGTRLDQSVPFDADADEVRIPIQVPLRQTTETLLLQLDLRRDADAIFSGTAEVVLTAGQTAEIDIPLQPVVAAVSCGGPDVTLDAYGVTAQLSAAALFATGDTVPAAGITWSVGGESPVTVSAAGLVTAQSDGTATVTCASNGTTDTRTVIVSAVVASVAVAPAQSAVVIGGTRTFTATARDRLQNVITGRTVTWSSNPSSIATVNASGVATGVAAGTTVISAAVGDVTGAATLTVSFPPPGVNTLPPTGVTGAEATFGGTVNPRGTAATAWFEFGTDPALATFDATSAQNVGAGTANVTVRDLYNDLSNGTTYYVRIAASSVGGTARGQIVSFTTPAPGPPSVRTVSAYYVPDSDAFLEMNGAFNPNGALTSVYFEWSQIDPTLTRPETTPIVARDGGWSDLPFTDGVFSNFQTTWVRAVAVNEFGEARGDIIQVDGEQGGGTAGPAAGAGTAGRPAGAGAGNQRR